MEKLNKIKKYNKIRTKLLLSALLISITGLVTLSIGFSKTEIQLSDKEVITTNSEELAINSFFDNMAVEEAITTSQEFEIKGEPVIKAQIADETNKEDPNKVKKADKGVAKSDTAANAVKKYETNETSLGIDVSTYQKTIDWKKVKDSGISFAMIRVGFRGTESGQIFKDNRFEENIKGAIANNINVGIYFFSMAANEREAEEEAAFVVSSIKNYDITYPVAIDMEIFNQNRLVGVSNEQMTSNALAFTNYIKAHGYQPMIYSSKSLFTNNFEVGRFGNIKIWLAQYYNTVTYKGNYHMWQYTSDGSVPGINGRVDMNVAYFSVTNDVTKSSVVTGANNFDNKPTEEFKSVDKDITLNKEVQLKSSPYIDVPNKAGSLPSGTNVKMTGISKNFIRINYKNNIFYINDTKCFNVPAIYVEPIEKEAKLTRDIKAASSPYEYLLNDEIVLKTGDEILITGLNNSFIEIKYNNNKYYISNIHCYEELTIPTKPVEDIKEEINENEKENENVPDIENEEEQNENIEEKQEE